MKTISKESFLAHNSYKEFPVSSEEYSKAHKLGTPEERLHLEGIAEDEYGFGSKHEKLSKAFLKAHYGISIV